MRYLMMHRTNSHWEAGARPSTGLIAAMGQLLGKMAQNGVFLAGEGLRASSLGVRLQYRGGQRTVTRGPFPGGNELIAGFMILRLSTIDDAVEWASRFAEIVGDVEIDIRPVTEPWDLGMCNRPDGLTTTRFMAMHKADGRSEAGVPRTPQQTAAMQRLLAEMKQAGVLLAVEELQPSSRGVRIRFTGTTRTVTDGPFTESKELIAGFIMLQCDSREDAMAWAPQFAECVGDVELDIRPMHDSTIALA